MKLLKNFFFLLLFICSQSIISQKITTNDSINYVKFLKEKKYKEKVKFLNNIKNKESIMSYKDWLAFFEKEKENYKSSSDPLDQFFINMAIFSIYHSQEKYEEVLKIAYQNYYENKSKVDDFYLCELLNHIYNVSFKLNRMTELFFCK